MYSSTCANAAEWIDIRLLAVQVVSNVSFCFIAENCDEAGHITIERDVPSKSVFFNAWYLPQLQTHCCIFRCRPDYIFFSQRFARTQIREVPYFHHRLWCTPSHGIVVELASRSLRQVAESQRGSAADCPIPTDFQAFTLGLWPHVVAL